MDEAAALIRLASMVAADSSPTLTSDDLIDLLDFGRRADQGGNSYLNISGAPAWQASYTYQIGQVVKGGTNRWWRVLQPGVSGTGEPTWPNLGVIYPQPAGYTTVYDGQILWVDNGTLWVPTWDLDAAAAEGWRRKAAKVAGQFTFGTGDQMFNRSEVHAMCLEMADRYSRRVSGTVTILR